MVQEETDSDNYQEWSCLIYELQDLLENVFCCTSQNSDVYDEDSNIRTSIISSKEGERRSFYQSIQGLFPLILPQDETYIGAFSEKSCSRGGLSDNGRRSVNANFAHSPSTTVIGDEGLVQNITTNIPNF
jgi:hypothetical protein